jgi:hypothetical protein
VLLLLLSLLLPLLRLLLPVRGSAALELAVTDPMLL